MEIIKVTLESPYGRYFLSPYDIYTEAPGDNKPSASTVTATPKNDPLSATPPEMGSGDSGGGDGGDPLSSSPPDMDTGDADAAMGPNTDSSTGGDTGGGGGGDPLSATPPDMDAGDDIAGGNDAGGGGAAPDGPNTDDSVGGGDDGPNTDDSAVGDDPNTDDSGLGDDAGGEEGGEEDVGGDGDASSGDDNKNGVDYNNTRMWLLSKEFINVHKAVSVYLEKLSGVIIDNDEAGAIVKKCVDSLTEIKEIIFDYVTIKFSLSSYVQNLLFYEKIVTSVKLNFKLLKEAFEICEKAKESDDKSKSSSKKNSKTSDDKGKDKDLKPKHTIKRSIKKKPEKRTK